MKRGLLVFLPNEMIGYGDRVFFYDHAESGDPEYDANWVRVYENHKQEKPSIRLHIDRVKIVTTDMAEERHGGLYLKPEYSMFK